MVVVPAVQVRECGGSASSTKMMLAACIENFSCGCSPIVVVNGNVFCMQHLIISQHSCDAL